MNKMTGLIPFFIIIISTECLIGNDVYSSNHTLVNQFLNSRSDLGNNPVLKYYTDLRLSIISKDGLDELIALGKVLIDLRGPFNEGDDYLVIGEPGMSLLETLNFYMDQKGIKPRNFLTVKLFTKDLIYQNYYFKINEGEIETLDNLKLVPGDIIFTNLYGDF